MSPFYIISNNLLNSSGRKWVCHLLTYFLLFILCSRIAPINIDIAEQCCGSRSGIRCFLCFFDPGIRIQDEPPVSYFRELRNNVLVLKCLNSRMRIRIRNPESFWPWIRDPGKKNLDPGSGINIPDPQHFCCIYWIVLSRSPNTDLRLLEPELKEICSSPQRWKKVHRSYQILNHDTGFL